MERVFKIEAFRNMGFKDGKPEATELLLNESAAKGHLGNCLTVVGANGAGKTNVLDGLTTYTNEKFAETDVTNLFYENVCKNPALKMEVTDGELSYSQTKSVWGGTVINFPDKKTDAEAQKEREDHLFADLDSLCWLEDKYLTKTAYISNSFNVLRKALDEQAQKSLEDVDEESKKKLSEAKEGFRKSLEQNAKNFVEEANRISEQISHGKFEWGTGKVGKYNDDEIAQLYNAENARYQENRNDAYRHYMSVCQRFMKIKNPEYYTSRIKYFLDNYRAYAQGTTLDAYNNNEYSKFMSQLQLCSQFGDVYYRYLAPKNAMSEKFFSAFLEKYGFRFNSRIRTYTQSPITSEMLNTDIQNIRCNSFYIALFNAMGVSLEQVENAYRLYNQTQTRAFLSDFQKECEEKIKPVEEKFNKLFMFSSSPYGFSIEFERGGGIFFTIYRKEKPQVLDLQSTGFRYFFDLFFNLLNTTTLESGDIIIMDEPALNLHVKGQRELREFLKEFAIRNDILIIIATHSPFLIDIDNLDDIRVVASDGAVSRIENNFTAVDPTDPDSLLPIKEALTVENHVLVNPKETVVFVQTMEEYCYLVAFKKLFEIKGISFLPVNFVSADKVQCEIALKRIREIRDDAFILVHDDDIGNTITDLCKESAFTVFTLSNIDESFTTVANLFADGEQLEGASTFKNFIHHEQDKVGENTKANFRKVFDWFKNES